MLGLNKGPTHMMKRPGLCFALLRENIMERIFNVAETNVNSYKKISQASIEFEDHRHNADGSFMQVYEIQKMMAPLNRGSCQISLGRLFE